MPLVFRQGNPLAVIFIRFVFSKGNTEESPEPYFKYCAAMLQADTCTITCPKDEVDGVRRQVQ